MKNSVLFLGTLLRTFLLVRVQSTICHDHANVECSSYGDHDGKNCVDENARLACCSCGGGVYENIDASWTIRELQSSTYQCEGNRTNVYGWTSSEGLDCAAIYENQLSNNTLCSNQFPNLGYTESTACCFCPFGGIDVSQVVFKEVNNSETQCLNRANWEISSTVPPITCDSIAASNCPPWANIVLDTENELLGREACCACEGGGYTGPLIGQTFRANFVTGTESYHQMFQYSDGTYGGSIYEFAESVSATYGFGLYQTLLTYTTGTSSYNVKLDCLRSLLTNQIDICVGPLWDSGSTTLFTKTKKLATDDFYIITPYNKHSIGSYFVSVSLPFHWKVWTTIFGLILFLGFALHVINPRSYHQHKLIRGPCSILHRLMHVLYSSIRSCISYDVVDMDHDPSISEKIIIVGFFIFSILTISSYTASVAAVLVNNDDMTLYSSLADVVRDPSASICLYSEPVERFQNVVAGVHTNGINGTVFDILDGISDNGGTCTAAMLPINHYERAILMDDSYCKTTKILIDEVIFSLDVELYISRFLSETMAEELVAAFSSFIDTGEYGRLDSSSLTSMRSVKYDKDLYKASNDDQRRNLQAAIIDAGAEICDTSISTVDQLSFYHLLFPFTFTFICTTLGLAIFYVRQITKSYQRRRRLQNKSYASISQSVSDEEAAILMSIRSMSSNEILYDLFQRNVDHDEVDAAAEELPDMSKLCELLLRERLSPEAKVFKKMMNISLLTLFQIYMKHCPIDEEGAPLLVLDLVREPKSDLLDAILLHPQAKAEVMSLLDSGSRATTGPFFVCENSLRSIDDFDRDQDLVVSD